MEGLIVVIAIGWFIFSLIGKGLRAANQSGQKNRSGQASPQDARPRPPYPPLTPTARPGQTGAPDWGDIMTMLGGGTPAQTRQLPDMEGESTEASGPFASMTGSSMMEGSPLMMQGPGMMEGSAPMMDASQPDYEGKSLPGEAPLAAPQPEISVAPPLRLAASSRRYDSTAMRDAVVWAEILAKPKSLRRVAR